MSVTHLIRRVKRRIAVIPLKLFANQLVEFQWGKDLGRQLISNHKLPGQLIVNLTSFPPRFETLHLTLKSLLLQDTTPDKLVLWIYKEDFALLPKNVLDLRENGLTIEVCDADIRSYKKLIPALIRWPAAFLVTADDDLYYRRAWLTDIVQNYNEQNNCVLCLRAHKITRDAYSNEKRYKYWQKKTEERGPSTDLLFTSGSGVLFPPGSLHEMTTREDLFMHLAPHADDIWLYWMAVINGSTIMRVGNNQKLISWKSSKKSSLWSINKSLEHGNDAQFAQVKRFLAEQGIT